MSRTQKGADQTGWILREDYDELTKTYLNDHILRLLPGFDAYMPGHAEKTHLVDAPYYKRIYRNAWMDLASCIAKRKGSRYKAWESS